MNIHIVEAHLRRENALPADFAFYRHEEISSDTLSPHMELEGGRCPLVASGPRKGEPNTRRATECRVFCVSPEEAAMWESEALAAERL